MPAIEATGAARAGDSFAAAHARLLADRAFQFAFERPVAPKPPRWLIDFIDGLARLLRALAKLSGGGRHTPAVRSPFDVLAPYLGWLLWAALAVGVVAILALAARELALRRGGGARLGPARPAPADWRPDPAAAKALLGDADALAAAGRFGEAARLLLHRSIADIERHRPDLVATDHTSRDIAALDRLPAAARAAFRLIVARVEASLFALQPLDAAAFAECRAAYADFALPAAWSAA